MTATRVQRPAPRRTLEVSSSNRGAKFVAYYGYDEESVETVEVQSRGLCHGEEYRRANFKGAIIRVAGDVTSRPKRLGTLTFADRGAAEKNRKDENNDDIKKS